MSAFGFGQAKILCGALCAVSLLTAAKPAAAVELITEKEAALPDDSTPALITRGLSRRPTVVVVSPAPNAGAVYSPLELKLRFQAFGGARIDPESVVVTYKKLGALNITNRIAPYVTANGIDMPQAEVPPGVHKFKIELKDMDGHPGSAEFSFQVTR